MLPEIFGKCSKHLLDIVLSYLPSGIYFAWLMQLVPVYVLIANVFSSKYHIILFIGDNL